MIEVNGMFPVMVTADLSLVKAFYQSVFGFKVVFYQADFYLHLASANNAIELGFLMPAHVSQPEFLQAKMVTEGYVLSLEVANAEQAFAQAQQLELNVVMPIKDEVWGQRHFIISDPAGIHIDIVEHLKN